MLRGTVNREGEPRIALEVAGHTYSALVDTGFNGDLELPEALRAAVNPRPIGRFHSLLAGGQLLEEDFYLVEFPFDGELVTAEASFIPDGDLLVGTGLLQQYRLEVDFVKRSVLLERTAAP